MTFKREIELQRRQEAGLPILACPNCGLQAVAHWVPDALDDYGLVVRGYFTCEVKK